VFDPLLNQGIIFMKSLRVAFATFAAFSLAGCAGLPVTQPLDRKVADTIQPMELTVGIKQPELYAQFEPSMVGQSMAIGCGAVPGLGILLAAACGGAGGAIDATVNAERAKTADTTIRPLKDDIIDVNVDRLLQDALSTSLTAVPSMKLASTTLVKAVDDKAYEASFRASTASAVMFINVDYHLTRDFSTLELSARSLVYPRGEAARVAAGQPKDLPTAANELATEAKNSVYRSEVYYRVKLSDEKKDGAGYLELWRADGAHLLRAALTDGSVRLAKLIAEDLQRVPPEKRSADVKLEKENGVEIEVVSETVDGRLLRHPNGTVHYWGHASPLVAARKAALADAIGKADAQPVPAVTAAQVAPTPAPAAQK
jgi:hypothetical protein